MNLFKNLTSQKNKMINKKEKINKTLRYVNIILIFGIITVLISPWLFTRALGIISFSIETGAIGDTIGGITAPIVNLIGAILVYFALKAQITANSIIQDQIDFQEDKESITQENSQIHKLYNHLETNIKDYKFTQFNNPFTFEDNETIVYQGSLGIHKFFGELRCNYHGTEENLLEDPSVTELLGILKICNLILSKLEFTKATDKDIIYILTKHQFEFRIFPALKGLKPDDLDVQFCESCGNNHGIPKILLSEIDEIKEKINYI